MNIWHPGDRPTQKAPNNYFTGAVWQDAVITVPAPGRLRAVLVRFDPGARTFWHTHPLGQTLFVTGGCGRVALRGEPSRIIRQGDTVFIPEGVEHWHGAGTDTSMTHLAMQEARNNSVITWLEEVSETDYTRPA
ncbi:MAG: cupin domain-containing protein [Rhodobacteraceae bacterium]|nr:cupin domain-containing protein [Paracoccaceae bacterium]